MDVIDLTSQILVDGKKRAKSENQVCNGKKSSRRKKKRRFNKSMNVVTDDICSHVGDYRV